MSFCQVPCRYGAKCFRADCRFTHPDEDRIVLPEQRTCVWFQKGKCRNGTKCPFQHVQEERDGNIIVVRNLPKADLPEALHFQLLQHFKSFGYITRIQVKTDLDQRCRGFAFVIFADACSAMEAVNSEHPDWDIKLKADLPMFPDRFSSILVHESICFHVFNKPHTIQNSCLPDRITTKPYTSRTNCDKLWQTSTNILYTLQLQEPAVISYKHLQTLPGTSRANRRQVENLSVRHEIE